MKAMSISDDDRMPSHDTLLGSNALYFKLYKSAPSIKRRMVFWPDERMSDKLDFDASIRCQDARLRGIEIGGKVGCILPPMYGCQEECIKVILTDRGFESIKLVPDDGLTREPEVGVDLEEYLDLERRALEADKRRKKKKREKKVDDPYTEHQKKSLNTFFKDWDSGGAQGFQQGYVSKSEEEKEEEEVPGASAGAQGSGEKFAEPDVQQEEAAERNEFGCLAKPFGTGPPCRQLRQHFRLLKAGPEEQQDDDAKAKPDERKEKPEEQPEVKSTFEQDEEADWQEMQSKIRKGSLWLAEYTRDNPGCGEAEERMKEFLKEARLEFLQELQEAKDAD